MSEQGQERTYFVVRTDNINAAQQLSLTALIGHIPAAGVLAHVIERDDPIFHDVSDMRNRLAEGRPTKEVDILGEFGAFKRNAEEETSKLIAERDHWESKATELADGIATHFGADFGEHSSANCLVQNTIDFVFNLESTECITKELKRWTAEDQNAGRLPDAGAKMMHDGATVKFRGCNIHNSNLWHIEYESGVFDAVFESKIKPIETPEELSQRLLNERIARMVVLFEDVACHQTYNMQRGIAAVVKSLTKELSEAATEK